tara:strand:- start:2188 stop:3330 length:1143 start_codon:yes stop_codon:yes gene_type:complete
MPETDIGNASLGDIRSNESVFSVDSETTDGPQESGETFYINSEFAQQLGYYKKIPELKAAIDAKARWTIGKGYTSNPITEMFLDTMTGFGKDTFNKILENQMKTAEIGGDSFAEIIRDEKGDLINLKPLDPSRIQIVANSKGIIQRYEQINKAGSGKTGLKAFSTEKIFHLSRDRVADEIHGVSVVDAVEETILARNEAIRDYRKLLRRNIYPVRIFHLDTDNTSEIATFKALQDKAQYEGDNIYIPKGAVETEISAVASNATLNPLPWIQLLTQKFYQEVGTPQIIVGGAQEITEASAKIAYLVWEQTVEEIQLYIEEQVLAQLNLEINLEFPASLQQELLSDGRKDVENGAISDEDVSAQQGVGLNGNQEQERQEEGS